MPIFNDSFRARTKYKAGVVVLATTVYSRNDYYKKFIEETYKVLYGETRNMSSLW